MFLFRHVSCNSWFHPKCLQSHEGAGRELDILLKDLGDWTQDKLGWESNVLATEPQVMKYISIELLHGEYFHCRLQESFQTAKLAYRQFKLRVRKTLSSSHMGPETLEDATVDYIVRNLDLYDVQASVNVRLITHLLIINCASFPRCYLFYDGS